MPLSALVGHRHLVGLVARALGRDSLPPSLIFGGPDGVGKFTAAVAVAEAVNCLDPMHGQRDGLFGPAAGEVPLEFDSCGVCQSCRRIARAVATLASGAEPALDCFRVLRPDEKGSIKIDRVRALLAACAFRPFDGRRRVAVIDDADALETGAQNALLKALEEPPPGTVFVLVTSQPDALLPTIRSRCPRLRFGPLASGDIATFLEQARRCDAEQARVAASLAGGSLGRALELVDGETVDLRRAAAEFLERAAPQADPLERLAAARALVSGEGGRGAKRATADRADVAERLRAVSSMLRDFALVSSRADAQWLANADLAPLLARLAPAYDGRRSARAFAAVDRAEASLDRNVSHKAVADWIAFEV